MNAFQIFGLDPTPWLDQETLRERYLQLSSQLHPDAAPSDDPNSFTQLQTAYQLLCTDRLRVRLFLEILGEAELPTVGAVPSHLADFFMKTGGLIAAADRLLKQRAEAESFLEKASLQAEALEKSEALQNLLTEFLSTRTQLQGTLQTASPKDVDLLKTIIIELSYLDRWIEQVQEKMFLLVD
jgi:hypothetical protein